MSGNSIGTGSYSSTPDWGERRKQVADEFNDGIAESKRHSAEYSEVTDARNQTSREIAKKKDTVGQKTTTLADLNSVIDALESNNVEQIKNNPYLAKFIRGTDTSGAFAQKGSVMSQITNLMNELKKGNLSLEDLQALFTTQTKQRSASDVAFWDQQWKNGQLVDEMRFLNNMQRFETLG